MADLISLGSATHNNGDQSMSNSEIKAVRFGRRSLPSSIRQYKVRPNAGTLGGKHQLAFQAGNIA